MFDKYGCNMSHRESYIRSFVATLLIFYAFYTHSYILGIIGAIILYSAYRRFCVMFHLLKINSRFSKDNYYLSLLPKHSSSPVFIFDGNGEVVFKNKPGHIVCGEILKIEDLDLYNHAILIADETKETLIYRYKDQSFQVEITPIKDDNLILAYFTDITEVVALNDEIEETQREVIYAMGEIGETRSKETGNHVKRVAEYSKLLALLYGLTQEEAEKLKIASPMHDIGKVGIPDAILNAPRKLTAEEFEVMKTHAELGYNMLKHSNKAILQAAAVVAGEHHEKYDGSGYPNHLEGKQIHIFARITAIADVFDALGSERVYKKAWELEKILNYFQEQKGKHFDPKLVELFVNHLDKFLGIRDKFRDLKPLNLH